MNEYDYQREETNRGFIDKPQTQETPVTEQENPAVSKLREAFDTARNAIIEGSALAIQVEELRRSVSSLNSEVSLLQRDLEYIRSRNKELDEQVTEVRRQRDNAISEGLAHKDRADKAESTIASMEESAKWMSERVNVQANALDNARKERDDAMVMALEYEGKLKEAEAKLAKIEEAMHGIKVEVVSDKTVILPAKPHYVDQPRDEVGKFQPFDEGKVYPSGSQGESSF